jgi:CDP-diacylglycerol--glycerol-3-phosphate 3-phosphatidyltransferase
MQISAEKPPTLGGVVAETFWTLPNVITVSRMALTPFLFALPWFHGRWWSTVMGIAFLAVSLTDLLDGYLARLQGQESRIGKLLDPLADKLLVMTAFVMLVGVGRVPSWALPLVVAILAWGVRLVLDRRLAWPWASVWRRSFSASVRKVSSNC